MSVILETGKTPAEWCDVLAAKGLPISERTLRQKARQIGACYTIGNAMIITPEQIERIFEEAACQPKVYSHTGAGKRGGPRGASNTTGVPSPITSGKALAHLTKLARGTGSPKGKTSNGVVTLLARSAR